MKPSDEIIQTVKALTTISSAIPLAQRARLKSSFDDVLKAVGSSIDKFDFLIGPMPARSSPFGDLSAKTHLCVITYQGVNYNCLATINEIAVTLRRSVQMVRIYLRNPKYREHHSDQGPTVKFELGELFFTTLPPGTEFLDLPSLPDVVRELRSKKSKPTAKAY